MTNNTARGVLFLGALTMATGMLLLVQGGMLAVGSAGCTPAARQTLAQEAQSPLEAGCSIVGAIDPKPWIELSCASLEAADALITRIPTGVKLSKVEEDAGAAVTVRVPLATFGSDLPK